MLCEKCHTHEATIGTECIFCILNGAEGHKEWAELVFKGFYRDRIQPTRELLKDEQ